MPRYRDDAKEMVRDAVDFVELVSARTELRRSSGSGFMGRCPFHDERTASFSVDGTKKLFHCFGCGEAGDVFRFVELTEGVDFKGALELLADRVGVELPVEDDDPQAAERRRRRDHLLALLERTATFYVRNLWESPEAQHARAYLLGRGLLEPMLREFRVGYAPSAWDTVLMASQRSGFKARELHDAGLVQRSGKGEGRVYDRFRGRIMFPLANARGQVLGFGARALRPNQQPKYLNTSENELFHKGRLVYGADLARAHAAKAGTVIVCEGYTDVVALHQAGLRNTVASMGTALTEDQLGELQRMAPTVVLALDADTAGQEAMLRAAKVAAGRKLELRVVALPEGRDPADVVTADGPDAMRALVEGSVPFVRFRVERTLATGDRTSAEGKDRILAELRPAFATVPPSVTREELLRLVADRLDVPGDLVARLVGAAPAAPAGRAPAVGGGRAAEPVVRVPARSANRHEATFLIMCLALPAAGGRALAELDLEHFADDDTRALAAWLREHSLDERPADERVAAMLDRAQHRANAETYSEADLAAERLQLELALVNRRLARGEGSAAKLAERRRALQEAVDRAVERTLT